MNGRPVLGLISATERPGYGTPVCMLLVGVIINPSDWEMPHVVLGEHCAARMALSQQGLWES